jgi:hypothetical protein
VLENKFRSIFHNEGKATETKFFCDEAKRATGIYLFYDEQSQKTSLAK